MPQTTPGQTVETTPIVATLLLPVPRLGEQQSAYANFLLRRDSGRPLEGGKTGFLGLLAVNQIQKVHPRDRGDGPSEFLIDCPTSSGDAVLSWVD